MRMSCSMEAWMRCRCGAGTPLVSAESGSSKTPAPARLTSRRALSACLGFIQHGDPTHSAPRLLGPILQSRPYAKLGPDIQVPQRSGQGILRIEPLARAGSVHFGLPRQRSKNRAQNSKLVRQLHQLHVATAGLLGGKGFRWFARQNEARNRFFLERGVALCSCYAGPAQAVFTIPRV